MRFILIIQSLLLLAAGWYIYTMRQEPEIVTPSPAKALPLPVYSTTTPVVEEVPAATSSDTTVEIDIAGPNDAGMEFPTFDGELEVR